jgi:hypothetical protein
MIYLISLKPDGGERDRTDDLLRAKQVLSQLSYTPLIFNLKQTIYDLPFRYLFPIIKIENHQYSIEN